MRLDGRRALVTGAGEAIGRAIALRPRGKGAALAALGRTAADLALLAAETGCEALLADLAGRKGAVVAIRARLPSDRRVNAVGITHCASALDTAEAAANEVYGVNVRGTLRVRSSSRTISYSAIVNVSSTAAPIGSADHAACCA